MGFLHVTFLDLLDILLVAVLLYYTYKLIKGTVAINIFIGIALVFIIWKVTQALHMEMLSGIFGHLIGGGVIALIIVFQQEVRKFLLMLGSANFSNRKSFIKQMNFLKSEIQNETNVNAIINTCEYFSQTGTGALIVLECTQNIDYASNSGDHMHAEVNEPILESIFYKNSPLHDGAVIIKDNYIKATRVVLPLSLNTLPSKYGLRHRAAMGITEKTDATCLVVSEETGKITYIRDGEFVLFDSLEELSGLIRRDLD